MRDECEVGMKDADGHRYVVVDVFTEQPLEGNALAVFPDASGLDERWMPRIAKELNLSETVFMLPATRKDCTARLRIFTPTRELSFAGHPTVGTAFVLMEEGMIARETECFSLEEKGGPVAVRVEAGERPLIWLRTPPIEHGTTYQRAKCAEALGLESSDLLAIDPQLVTAGNPTIFIPVRSREAVDRAHLESDGLRKIRKGGDEAACVFVFAPTEEGAYSRMFAPELGIMEDPATGSSTGPLASFMLRHGLVASHLGKRFVSEQGTKMGRRSILHIQVLNVGDAQVVEVGGYVTPVAEAMMRLRR